MGLQAEYNKNCYLLLSLVRGRPGARRHRGRRRQPDGDGGRRLDPRWNLRYIPIV